MRCILLRITKIDRVAVCTYNNARIFLKIIFTAYRLKERWAYNLRHNSPHIAAEITIFLYYFRLDSLKFDRLSPDKLVFSSFVLVQH